MFWKIIATLTTSTFIFSGFDVLSTENCVGVDFGGSRRSSTYACTYGEYPADLSQTTAGWLMILGPLLLWAVLWIPTYLKWKEENSTLSDSVDSFKHPFEKILFLQTFKKKIESQLYSKLVEKSIDIDTFSCSEYYNKYYTTPNVEKNQDTNYDVTIYYLCLRLIEIDSKILEIKQNEN